jgi:hypothetical protein
MPLHIRGPRADLFVQLLSRHCGLELVRDANTDQVTVSRDGLINPFVAGSLRDLVWRMTGPGQTVTITARGDVPGGIVDSFRGSAGAQIARRSVFLPDLLTVERLDPQFCAAMLAHFLAEYDHAAVHQTPNQFADAHVAGLRAEAEVIHELTGRPIFRGASRPWERTTTLASGRIRAERRYGPGNVYVLLLGPLPTAHIISVTRSGP